MKDNRAQEDKQQATGPECLPRLVREFFVRDGITVAKELLGKILVHETEIGPVRGIITEV